MIPMQSPGQQAAHVLDQATSHYQQRDFPRAEQLCAEVLAQQPSNKRALYMLGTICRQTARTAEAMEWLSRALVIEPNNALIHHELGNTLRELGDAAQAMWHYRQAITHDPRLAAAYTNLAALLQHDDQLEAALEVNLRAQALDPDCLITRCNLGSLHLALADLPAATRELTAVIDRQPDHAGAQWNLAVCHLLAGDFRRGWQAFDWRVAGSQIAIDRYPQPRWNGEPLTGKTLLVHAEQGIGDEILFASCFAEVLSRAGRCILICDRRLETLFKRSFPTAIVQGWQRKQDLSAPPIAEHVDFQIPAGDLPKFFRNDLQSFPRRARFLVPDGKLVSAWRERLRAVATGVKVGIAWRAGGRPAENRRRSHALESWRELLTMPGVSFINLQYGDTTAEVAAVERMLGVKIHDFEEGDPLIDMDSHAAKIAALDVVISVGNATVHLAGAVGTPTWAMLPHVPSWRWLLGGQETPWYSCVTLFRQPHRNDWQTVLEQVTERLQCLSGKRRGAVPATVVTTLAGQEPATSPTPEVPLDDQLLVPANLTARLAEGIALHQRGDLVTAETCYRQVLQIAPRNDEAWHMLGVLARQTNRAELATQAIRRAIGVNANVPEYHYHLASTLMDLGRLQEAIASLERALQLAPGFAPAHQNLGVVLQRLGEHPRAVASYRRAAELQPNSAEAQVNLGIALRKVADETAALVAFERALELDPHHSPAFNALGIMFLNSDRNAEARACFSRAIELCPQSAAAHNNLGSALRDAQREADSIPHYRRALELDPNNFEVIANLASSLAKTGEFAESAQWYRKALTLRPDHVESWNNLGMQLRDLGQFDAALDCFAEALRRRPGYADGHANRALVLLQLGRFAEGWPEYEWRWQCDTSGPPRNQHRQPPWDGSPLHDKTILVHGEQGVGDEVMFASCYPDVIQQSQQALIACDPRLLTLFARSFPQARFFGVERGDDHLWQLPPQQRADVQIAAGSLPLHLRKDWRDFPRASAFLTPEARRVAQWRERYAALGDGLKVGMAWRGGRGLLDQKLRWTDLADWQPLLQTPGVQWINLQYDDCQAELENVRQTMGVEIHGWSDQRPTEDLDGLAAQIAALDLVISVGNAGVHLAGALGVPAWCLLPCYRGWRWVVGHDTTPWYQSVRLFRQPRPGDWHNLFARVQTEMFNQIRQSDDTSWMRGVRGPAWLREQHTRQPD